MGIKKQLIQTAARAVLLTGRLTSPDFAMRAARGFAMRFELDPRLNKRQLRENIASFFPERGAAWVERTTRELQANAARARLLDRHFLPRLSTPELDRVVEVVGLERLQGVLDSGRGAVYVSPTQWHGMVNAHRRFAPPEEKDDCSDL